jgi:hypothetical protein
MPKTVAEIYNALQAQIEELEHEYLRDLIPAVPEHTHEIFKHKVKAYCVMAHAAFEEFVEDISSLVMHAAIDSRVSSNKKVSDVLVALSLFYNPKFECVEKEGEDQQTCFELMRAALNEVKESHSKSINENNGFSLKYLRKIFTPVFIDVPSDPPFPDSLRTLSEARGSFAHRAAAQAEYGQRGQVQQPMVPEKAKEVVIDCLKLCKEIATRADAQIS